MSDNSKVQECRDFLLRTKEQLMEQVQIDLNMTVDNECSRMVCDIHGDTNVSFEEITNAIINRVVIAIETIRDEE
jgi:hypothetical protein